MKMSTATIAAEARSQWLEPTASFITDTEVLRWLNMAENDFARYTKCLRYKFDLTTVASQQEYDFPADHYVSEILWVTQAGKDLWPVTIEELDNYKQEWRYAAGGPTGEPEFYYIKGVRGEQIGLYRTPDTVYTVTFYYVEMPAPISALDSSVYPTIRDTWHEALVHYVEWRGHKKNRNYELAGQARKDYQIVREQAKVEFLSLQPERTMRLSGPEYRPGTRDLQRPLWPSNYGREYY